MQIGIEKEMLVFDENFSPRNYTKEELDKNFTVDFANNQVEIISDVHNNVVDTINQMYELLNEEKIVYDNLWPLSQPGIDNYTPEFGVLSEEAKEYRQGLLNKYGFDYMNISGIHFNFSYSRPKVDNLQNYYFDLMKKIYVFSPLMVQFFGFTPIYQEGINDKGLEKIGKNRGFKSSISLRNTNDYGYLNENKFSLNYDSYNDFKNSIQEAIEENKIVDFREIYSKVRLKEIQQRIYLELRFIDINPFTRLGITFEQLTLLKLMIDYIETLNLDNMNIELAHEEFEKVAVEGLNKDIKININSKIDTLFNHTVDFLNQIKSGLTLNDIEENVIDEMLMKYINNDLDINRFLNRINNENLTIEQYGKKYSFKKEIFLPLYQNQTLELSTKILMKQSQEDGVNVEVLDEAENVIKLSKAHKSELVVQATKTNKDKYVNILMMENKVMTKKILNEKGVNTPLGKEYLKGEEIDYTFFEQFKTVIKPVDTNFGLGITILNKNTSKEQIDKALDFAYSYGSRIIIEQFIEGTEYRFLVINDEVISVLKRTPANIMGDGIHTIKQLIEIKNKNPLRNKGYVTPLEYLTLSEIEQDYLGLQNLDENSVLKDGQLVYLRKNSNISTGGDSEEVFCKIPNYFKQISVKAAQVLDVKICGIDMILNDSYTEYSIIEANFNPAIQMHVYPLKGIGENVAQKILNLLFEEENM